MPSTFAVASPETYMIGIAGRTTNAAEFAGNGIIPSLWKQFFQDSLADRIPNKKIMTSLHCTQSSKVTIAANIPIASA